MLILKNINFNQSLKILELQIPKLTFFLFSSMIRHFLINLIKMGNPEKTKFESDKFEHSTFPQQIIEDYKEFVRQLNKNFDAALGVEPHTLSISNVARGGISNLCKTLGIVMAIPITSVNSTIEGVLKKISKIRS